MNFDKMITPMIIKVIFWISVVLTVLGGLLSLGGENAIAGVFLILFGPLVARIYAELLLVLFQVHSRMNDIYTLLDQRLSASSVKTSVSAETSK
jgi:hypothetical protein